MTFNIHGQQAAVDLFVNSLNGRLHHAYLLSGPAHVGKTTLARLVSQAVNCLVSDQAPCGECEACRRIADNGHADVQTLAVDPDSADGPRTLIGINAVRDLIGSAHLRPYEGRRRVFIIQGADALSIDAANALLKVLEEPPPDVLLLLLTDNPDGVLPTVRSRCQTVALRPLPERQVKELLQAEHGVTAEQAHVIARLSRGCLGWAIEASRDPAVLAGMHQRTEKIADVIDGGLEARLAYADDLARRFQRDKALARGELFLWLRWLRDLLLVQQGQAESVANVSWRGTLERQAEALTPSQTVGWLNHTTETLELLEKNANARLVLDALMLESPRMQAAATLSLPI